MLTLEYLLENNNNIDGLAEELQPQDISFLVNLLVEKNDEIRYSAFLVLQKRSEEHSDVYPYWNTFLTMLDSDNSYHRSIGIMLISLNVKWDQQNKLEQILPTYLKICDDEKFITARQAILGIKKWAQLKPQVLEQVATELMKIDIFTRKDSQQKLLMMDILVVLYEVYTLKPMDEIMTYALRAASSGVLDPKSVKLVERMFLN